MHWHEMVHKDRSDETKRPRPW